MKIIVVKMSCYCMQLLQLLGCSDGYYYRLSKTVAMCLYNNILDISFSILRFVQFKGPPTKNIEELDIKEEEASGSVSGELLPQIQLSEDSVALLKEELKELEEELEGSEQKRMNLIQDNLALQKELKARQDLANLEKVQLPELQSQVHIVGAAICHPDDSPSSEGGMEYFIYLATRNLCPD